MSMVVVTGATLACPFGTQTSVFKATNAPLMKCAGKTIGNIMDGSAGTNISPFGLCKTLSNPEVAAATAAALGVLTPQPCKPQTKVWTPGSATLLIGGKPILSQSSTCNCLYGGGITVTNPGQTSMIV